MEKHVPDEYAYSGTEASNPRPKQYRKNRGYDYGWKESYANKRQTKVG